MNAQRKALASLERRLDRAGKSLEDAVVLYLAGRLTPDFNALLAKYKDLAERAAAARSALEKKR